MNINLTAGLANLIWWNISQNMLHMPQMCKFVMYLFLGVYIFIQENAF